MAKEIEFSVEAPMSGELAIKLWNFLIETTAKRENVEVTGTVMKIDKAS